MPRELKCQGEGILRWAPTCSEEEREDRGKRGEEPGLAALDSRKQERQASRTVFRLLTFLDASCTPLEGPSSGRVEV